MILRPVLWQGQRAVWRQRAGSALFVTTPTSRRLRVRRRKLCPADRAQLREQHGDREQCLLAEPPLREGKEGGSPRLLDFIRQESGQAFELGDRAIDEDRGSV